jgi:hypothetical protein
MHIYKRSKLRINMHEVASQYRFMIVRCVFRISPGCTCLGSTRCCNETEVVDVARQMIVYTFEHIIAR